jgi:hypothetical protein
MINIKNYFYLFFLLFFSCSSHEESQSEASQPTEIFVNIEDFEKVKEKFNIKEIKAFDLECGYLAFYKNGHCGFKFEKDSVLDTKSYVISFNDSSNTQIDVIKFSSSQYSEYISHQLLPLVNEVRNKSKEDLRKFCISYYLSRIYNLKQNGATLFLFGYDGINASSGNITKNKLKNLDRVCESIDPKGNKIDTM